MLLSQLNPFPKTRTLILLTHALPAASALSVDLHYTPPLSTAALNILPTAPDLPPATDDMVDTSIPWRFQPRAPLVQLPCVGIIAIDYGSFSRQCNAYSSCDRHTSRRKILRGLFV